VPFLERGWRQPSFFGTDPFDAGHVNPIVVGASISNADGYYNNFIFRFWEHIAGGFIDKAKGDSDPIRIAAGRITMEILVPQRIGKDTGRRIFDYFDRHGFRVGTIQNAGIRGMEFRYRIDEDGRMTVCDIPTTITATYSIVKDILNLEADDEEDPHAEHRFVTKEIDTFTKTLRQLMSEAAVREKGRLFRKSGPEIESLVSGIAATSLTRIEL